jgi:two-component system sensor histidine kinase YesM
MVRSYIAIERLRLDNRLIVVERVPTDSLTISVPRFSLQIPIENAIQHGVASCTGPVTVTITTRVRRGKLTLSVHDNGTGRKGEVHSVSLPHESTEIRQHGLSLLAARLEIAYGDGARLRLFRKSEVGAVCVLRLPVNDSSSVRNSDDKPV